MCSNSDSNVSMINEIAIKLDANTKCRCCQDATASILLRLKDPYCNNCFVSYIHHKLRSSLGKSKLMRPSDNVLVAFSGGMASLALLHMLSIGKNKNDAKKLLYDINVCYIEDGFIRNKSLAERKAIIDNYKSIAESYNFKFYWTSLNRCYTDAHVLPEDVQVIENNDDFITRLLNEVKSSTAKEDLLLKLKKELLSRVAIELGCNKIFTAESQTALAVKLLVSLAEGCEQLSNEVGFEDGRYGKLQILRPMRDIDNYEIKHYNEINDLKSSDSLSFAHSSPSNGSIRELTETFIGDLQSEFPSTVSTVFRTGEKLNIISIDDAENENICLLCKIVYKRSVEKEYLAVNATAFSRIASRPKTSSTTSAPDGCCSEGSATNSAPDGCCGDCSRTEPFFNEEDLKHCFCYSCLLIVREMKSLEVLPPSILNDMRKRCNLLTLKEQISDFLL